MTKEFLGLESEIDVFASQTEEGRSSHLADLSKSVCMRVSKTT